MKLLITGSEGSLAQIVIPYLLKDGHEIIGVDNFAVMELLTARGTTNL